MAKKNPKREEKLVAYKRWGIRTASDFSATLESGIQ